MYIIALTVEGVAPDDLPAVKVELLGKTTLPAELLQTAQRQFAWNDGIFKIVRDWVDKAKPGDTLTLTPLTMLPVILIAGSERHPRFYELIPAKMTVDYYKLTTRKPPGRPKPKR